MLLEDIFLGQPAREVLELELVESLHMRESCQMGGGIGVEITIFAITGGESTGTGRAILLRAQGVQPMAIWTDKKNTLKVFSESLAFEKLDGDGVVIERFAVRVCIEFLLDDLQQSFRCHRLDLIDTERTDNATTHGATACGDTPTWPSQITTLKPEQQDRQFQRTRQFRCPEVNGHLRTGEGAIAGREQANRAPFPADCCHLVDRFQIELSLDDRNRGCQELDHFAGQAPAEYMVAGDIIDRPAKAQGQQDGIDSTIVIGQDQVRLARVLLAVALTAIPLRPAIVKPQNRTQQRLGNTVPSADPSHRFFSSSYHLIRIALKGARAQHGIVNFLYILLVSRHMVYHIPEIIHHKYSHA